jgi:hypothetical protein
MAFPKIKALLRKKAARSFDALCNALRTICDLIDPLQCRNFFKAAGYEESHRERNLKGRGSIAFRSVTKKP